MYNLILIKGTMRIPMPSDKGLSLSECCYRAELYKRRDPAAYYFAVNTETGDEIEL